MIKKTHSPTKKLTIVSGLIFSAIQSRKCTRQYKNKTAHTITPIVFTKAHNIVDTVDMVFNFNSFTNFGYATSPCALQRSYLLCLLQS